MRLSILCITRGETVVLPFLQRMDDLAADLDAEFVAHVDNRPEGGCLEDIHDAALAQTHGDYILRLDDDEACSPALVRWLHAKGYEASDHWKFARAALWGNPYTLLATPQLWPDHQTRLSVRAKAGGRDHIHAGSPHGGGTLAPACIEHHKFLIKTYTERKAIADRYDAIQHGAGRLGGMRAFQIPEDEYREGVVDFKHLRDGSREALDGAQNWRAHIDTVRPLV